MNIDDARADAILRGRRQVREIEIPAFGGVKVGLRVLLDEEVDGARLETAKWIREKAKEVGFDAAALLAIEPELFDRELQRQTLHRACIDPESDPGNPMPFFPSDESVRKVDSVTVGALWDAFVEHQSWVSPRTAVSDEAIEELVDTLGKDSAPGVTLAHFERATLESCVLSMARRLRAT